mmetsp:Transcript_65587/g.166199  ORF Transcript_65587/g.166199 Transcript_65587/m.166199 type:complete len:206 (+) Transcript_65587:232-849(+)
MSHCSVAPHRNRPYGRNPQASGLHPSSLEPAEAAWSPMGSSRLPREAAGGRSSAGARPPRAATSGRPGSRRHRRSGRPWAAGGGRWRWRPRRRARGRACLSAAAAASRTRRGPPAAATARPMRAEASRASRPKAPPETTPWAAHRRTRRAPGSRRSPKGHSAAGPAMGTTSTAAAAAEGVRPRSRRVAPWAARGHRPRDASPAAT